MSESVLDFSVIEMLRGLRMDGEADPLVELSETFVVESARSMRRLIDARVSGDQGELRRAAHIIKGMSATVGALRLSAMSRDIEKAEAGAVTDARLGELEVEIERVSVALTSAAGAAY
jgi:HPt (histidine-containing phosphotransfer) domain-containing protein